MPRNIHKEFDAAKERIRKLEGQLGEAEGASQRNWDQLDQIFENAPGGMAIVTIDGTILRCNQEAASLIGRSIGDLIGTSTEPLYKNKQDRAAIREELKERGRFTNYELPLSHTDGSTTWISISGKAMDYEGHPAALISFTDVTEHRKALKKIELDEIRFETLYTVSEMIDRPESEILDFALDAITKVTNSRMGYIVFLNEEETLLTLYSWSKEVMEMCKVESIPEVFKLEETGLWGDAVRLRKPVITNDYQGLPDKRGYPEGHVHITNHLNIPVFEDARIVMLAGVGNKDGDYTDEDVRQLELVMNGTWRILQRRRAEAAILAARDMLEDKVRLRTAELEAVNCDLSDLNKQLLKKDNERTRALSALAESEERFRSLFENNHSVMLLVNPENGNIVDANPAAVRYYGYTADELQSMNINKINTLTKEEIKREMEKAAQEKRTSFFFNHRLASGEIRSVEVFSGPVLINNQEILYSIIHDITERKRAEEALVRYERIVSSTPDLISLVDREYHYKMINDAYLRTFNKEREEIVDQHITALIGAELFNSKIKGRLDRAFAGETVSVENWFTTPDGRKLYFATTYHPVTVNGDTVDYVSMDSRDITELKRQEEDFQITARRLDMATDAGNIGIWERNLVTDKYYWDQKMYELYLVKPGEFESIYEAWRTRVHKEDFPELERKIAKSIETQERLDMEFRLVWPDREIRNMRVAGTTQTDENGQPLLLTGVTWDVTDQRRMENELRRLASTDPLTGASNRRHFMIRLDEELERCKRYKTPLVLLSLDIDHFKDINDTFGHPAGDDVLKDLVQQCSRTLRTTDVFGRVGGEEFLAALTQTGITAGKRTAERLRSIIENHAVKTHGHSVTYTISIGITELGSTDESINPLLQRADEALYKAKNNGRNRVEIV